MKIMKILKRETIESNFNKKEQASIDIMDIKPIRDKLYLPYSINAWYTTTLSEAITFIQLPTAISGSQILLHITQGSGANQVVFIDDVLWPLGRKPLLSWDKGAIDIIQFIALNETWLGRFIGGGMHVSE
ncbi:hypothetical protein I5F12_07470 [Proteus cibarius]|uniref:Uncharacterized protein n=1 Tax=Proteus terrae subsp. cibarius TaxID=626774 RepID=A0A6G6SWF5_9GAMM|nr:MULTISPECIES: hypothetical protein [Proteus]MBG2914623.1 hypothetical protein [Proteus terrae subsp. cibarius]MBG3090090.1 hypothetical protein [Proteus terrae subsp. cibarius]MBG6037909.1 hypothetical protein [Proteus terrae subsp. cibarius]MCM2366213.1 hypothetical protein [Proteus sp. FZP2095]MCO4180652.1 hypothetical protein [Proteus terrae]